MTVPLSLLTDLCLSSTHRNMSGLLTNQRWVKDRNKSFLHSSFNCQRAIFVVWLARLQSSNRCGQGLRLVSRNAHSIPHSPCVCKGGLKKFFIFLKVVTVAGFEPASHALKVRCRTTLLHRVEIVKRQTLDLWFIHCPQRETRQDKRSLSLSHAHCWASSFNSVLKDQVAH